MYLLKMMVVLCICTQTLRAQCPYISGLLADTSNSGSPAGEAKNEFLVFNTGASSIAVTAIFMSYGTNTTSTSFSVDGSVSGVWSTAATAGLLSNSSGSITSVSSGSIPANRNVIVISKDNTVSYDLKSFGTDVYVLSYDQTSAGVSSYSATGNFANTGAAARYVRIAQGALCRDTVNYIPNDMPGGGWQRSQMECSRSCNIH